MSQGRNKIEASDVESLCAAHYDGSLFELTNALRDRNIKVAISLYRHFITREDPMLLAATLASQIRTLAKIYLCNKGGEQSHEAIARKTKLNPYVVKLTAPLAQKMTNQILRQAYDTLLWFDSSVKAGRVASDLGVLLLIVRLHDNLKGRVSS